MLPFRLLSLLLFCQISESHPGDLYAEMCVFSPPQPRTRSSLCEIWPLIIEVMPSHLVTWAILPTPFLSKSYKGEVYNCLRLQFVTLSIVGKFGRWCCLVPHLLVRTRSAWRGFVKAWHTSLKYPGYLCAIHLTISQTERYNDAGGHLAAFKSLTRKGGFYVLSTVVSYWLFFQWASALSEFTHWGFFFFIFLPFTLDKASVGWSLSWLPAKKLFFFPQNQTNFLLILFPKLSS